MKQLSVTDGCRRTRDDEENLLMLRAGHNGLLFQVPIFAEVGDLVSRCRPSRPLFSALSKYFRASTWRASALTGSDFATGLLQRALSEMLLVRLTCPIGSLG
jgi:hypothetical protein